MPARIVEENNRRKTANCTPFDPYTGKNAPGKRFRLTLSDLKPSPVYLPVEMENNPLVLLLKEYGSIHGAAEKIFPDCSSDRIPGMALQLAESFIAERARYDFPFWAALFAKIKPKGGGADIPFILNRPQRKLVEKLEEMRTAGRPIRLILLKARQWGGSTCVQLYLSWMQLTQATGLNSLILAHQSAGSDEIKDMFDRMLAAYPAKLLYYRADSEAGSANDGGKPLKRVGNTGSIFRIAPRNCKIKVGTAERPDSSRGGDYNLVHLSEVGLWKRTKGKSPEDIVRSACSGVLLKPMTVIVLESTANGTGTFFHREYLAASGGCSQFEPLFVSWYEIDTYTKPLDDEEDFALRLWEGRNDVSSTDRSESGSYLWSLWLKGATLEAINWYVDERKKYSDHAGMASEYPSDDLEAFAHSGTKVFAAELVERMRSGIREPVFKGEITDEEEFVADSTGGLEVWRFPDSSGRWSERYIAVVDIGGRSDKADWSVIAVFDRCGDGGRPEIVAQWRGHIDHDMLAVKAAKLAACYDKALLVIESNTLESRDRDRDVDGNQAPYILQKLMEEYPNLYMRRTGVSAVKPGFHTNTNTKPMVIGELIKSVREHGYIERDANCLNELLQYERKSNGSYGAVTGCHDDILMTRAIGLYVSAFEMGRPMAAPRRRGRKSGKAWGEAIF